MTRPGVMRVAKKKGRPTKVGDLIVLSCVGVVTYYSYPPKQNLLAWIFGVPAVLMFWFLFLMPTKCDYMTQRLKPCDRSVRGKARGCRDHGRWKRDAIFATVGRRNPGQRFRMMWSAPATSPMPVPARPPRDKASREANATRGAYNLVMLIATVVSAIAAVVALVPR
ncbi:hypothetical protein ACQPYH_25145 [Kribbella sp. CA-245084]|uniref:hypothetical protein n=1 Tax=Kribbella sp. CA-245084 TaxID=3239940 RepID=UPI003D92F6AB